MTRWLFLFLIILFVAACAKDDTVIIQPVQLNVEELQEQEQGIKDLPDNPSAYYIIVVEKEDR